jgi:hypothetical protein
MSAANAEVSAVAIPAPPSGKGEVVFFRSGTIMGAAISCAVSENHQKISSLPPGNYFIAVAEPGRHTYSVSSEATDTLTLQVEPDEIQYASCHIKMGIMAGRPALAPANEAEFKTKSYKMVAAEKMGDGALRPDGTTSAHVQVTSTAPIVRPSPVADTTTPSSTPASVAGTAPAQ